MRPINQIFKGNIFRSQPGIILTSVQIILTRNKFPAYCVLGGIDRGNAQEFFHSVSDSQIPT